MMIAKCLCPMVLINLTLCHFVFTLLLPCNNIIFICVLSSSIVADLYNKYSLSHCVFLSILLYFMLILAVMCMQ